MKRLGIIAGGGELPFITAREARDGGIERIEAVGFPGQTSPGLESLVDALHWVRVGRLGKLIRTFREAEISEAVMVGKLDPDLVIRDVRLDLRMLALAARVHDRRAETVLKGIAGELHKDGIMLLDSTKYLSSCIVRPGVLTKKKPCAAVRADINFGAAIAKEISGLDIGQTVVVRKKAVVAVEAMEGTDETLKRAGGLCPSGMVAVKVSRPEQDMRFDVPVVGERTIEILAECGASAIALEAGRTIMLHRDSLLRKADEAKIAVVGI